MNLVMLEGFVGLDPKFIPTKSGSEFVKLSVATTEKWKDKSTGDDRAKTEWHNVTVFDPSFVSYIRDNVQKGSLVYLEGQICSNKWKDPNGVEKKSYDINVMNKTKHKFQVKSKRETPLSANTHGNYPPTSVDSMFMEDELPF